MPDESFPIEIGGEKFSLRFEDEDVKKIEQKISLFVAFHPRFRTYENAAQILWRGLRKVDEGGELVHAIQQGPPGEAAAFRMVKQFCDQFGRVGAGMIVLYGSFDKALIASDWYGEPVPEDLQQPTPPAKAGEDPPKNSVRPTNRPTRTWRTVFAGYLRKISDTLHRRNTTR